MLKQAMKHTSCKSTFSSQSTKCLEFLSNWVNCLRPRACRTGSFCICSSLLRTLKHSLLQPKIDRSAPLSITFGRSRETRRRSGVIHVHVESNNKTGTTRKSRLPSDKGMAQVNRHQFVILCQLQKSSFETFGSTEVNQ